MRTVHQALQCDQCGQTSTIYEADGEYGFSLHCSHVGLSAELVYLDAPQTAILEKKSEQRKPLTH